MKFLKLTTTDPYYNLAVEEYLFSHSNEDIFMLWQNSPVVVIGKNQNAYAEVDLDYARANNINIARRITGGGAVYHDLGNINYSYITSSDSSLDYEHLAMPIINALAKLGVEANIGGRNDILVGGRKISGNAQHSSKNRLLHHGTLLFNTDMREMEKVLTTDKEKLEHHGVHSHKSRVLNLSKVLPNKMTVLELLDFLEESVIEYFGAEKSTVTENSDILSIAQNNRNPDWILSSRKFLVDFTLKQKKRYPCGSIHATVSFERDIIKKISLTGDFFTLLPIEELESTLEGKNRYELGNVDISKYIVGMTNAEFDDLINH